jgi:acetylornithine deacetylase/succinyl-diaminopimelate desuccinylase-like protein
LIWYPVSRFTCDGRSHVESVLKAIESGKDASVTILEELLRIPSISADPDRKGDVQRAAEFLANVLRDSGLPTVEIIPTDGHPIVLGEWCEDPSVPTLLVYGHYDVQPIVDLAEWSMPPFEPQIRDGKIWARGATDDKGQVLAHVLSVAAHLRETGKLPVNVKLLIEGEEEIGSEHLAEFVQTNRDRLACDAIAISDSAMYAPGIPSICIGLRGIAYVEFTVRGPAADLHSGGFGGVIENPAVALAQVLAGLKDPGSGRILVGGFYDGVEEPTDEEKAGWAKLSDPDGRYLAMTGSPQLHGERDRTTLERVWSRPTLDVNGIWGGHTKPGESMTVLPAVASAKVSMRLVKNQRPADVVAKLRSHIEEHLPDTVTLERFVELHGGDPWTSSVDHPAVQAAFRAVEKGFGKPPVPTREGGSIPIIPMFTEILGAPVVLLGFGLGDEGAHGPDEHFDLSNFQAGIRTSAHYLMEFREVAAASKGSA